MTEDLQKSFQIANSILEGHYTPQSRIKQISNERPIKKLLRTLKERDPEFNKKMEEKEKLKEKQWIEATGMTREKWYESQNKLKAKQLI